jgi:hypothetical protein
MEEVMEFINNFLICLQSLHRRREERKGERKRERGKRGKGIEKARKRYFKGRKRRERDLRTIAKERERDKIGFEMRET